MAFPVPQHLPRASNPAAELRPSRPSLAQRILSELAQPPSVLISSTARKCLAELDKAIHDTKVEISAGIHRDLPGFDRQHNLALDIRKRMENLETGVGHLNSGLNDSEYGLLPRLLQYLSASSDMSQLSLDAAHNADTLQRLLRCRIELDGISDLMKSGSLPEASARCGEFSEFLSSSDRDTSAKGVKVWNRVLERFRTLDDSIEEQLSTAYRLAVNLAYRGEIVSLFIRRRVQVPKSSRMLDLPSIVSAMRDSTVSSISKTLGKDIMSNLILPLLAGKMTVHSSDDALLFEFQPRTTESIIPDLSRLLSFLTSSLPNAIFKSLHLNLSEALLDRMLIPSIPKSLSGLPGFLNLVKEVVAVEQQLAKETIVQQWSDRVGLHYEKGRQKAILESARSTVLSESKGSVEVEEEGELAEIGTPQVTAKVEPTYLDSRTFEMGQGLAADNDPDSGWDFDDDEETPLTDSQADLKARSLGNATHFADDSTDDRGGHEDEPDSADWVWNNESSVSTTAVEEDDPWDDPPPKPVGSDGSGQPRVAKRFAKVSASRMKNGHVDFPSHQAPYLAAGTLKNSAAKRDAAGIESLPTAKPVRPKQAYMVSNRAQDVLHLAEAALEEARELRAYKSLPLHEPPTGTLLLSTPSAVLDIFCALPPTDTISPRFVIFSNDCKYLARETAKISTSIKEFEGNTRWTDAASRLVSLSKRMMISAVREQVKAVNETLASAQSFVNVSSDVRFSECRDAVEKTMLRCASVGREWKSILTFSTYARALGAVIDSALSCIMEDILALPDITESESHRLDAICKMMHPVDNFFVDAPASESQIASYVQSWFKFNFLSTLLEASMADISEFFKEGLLVDFDLEEIARLIQALFSDTPLRARTIDMILSGHPSVPDAV